MLLRATMISKASAGRSSVRLTMLATLVLGMLAFASPAWAETFTVETTNDSGPSSLRQAVADANATVEPDTIVFALDAGATITLSSTLTVSRPLTIEGHPLRPLTISGNNAVRPFHAQRTALTISDMTIANGRASGATDLDNSGGAILNDQSTLTIRDSVLRNNSAARGGAIFARTSTLNVTNSTLSGNSAIDGGAIYTQFVFLTFVPECPATIANSTLANNSATNGGAIYNSGICHTQVDDTRVENNAASTNGGGIYNDGGLTVQRSSLNGNTANHDGGGIYNVDFATVKSSTFSGNAASTGGGIRNGEFVPSPGGPVATGTMTLERSTFVGNLANRARNLIETGEARSCGYNRGGGLYNEGTATLTANTFSGNHAEVYRPGPSCIGGDGRGGGIASYHDLTARGNIVAGNTGQVADVTCGCFGNNFVDAGFNIIGGTAAEAGLQTDAQGNPVLSNNGGPTQTVALVRGSRAIDAGNSFGAAADQRGTPRPKDYASVDNAQGGDGSDIGAFEYVDPDAAPPTVEASSSPLPNGAGLNDSDVTVSITASDEAGGSGVWRVSYSASGAQQVSDQNVPGGLAELVISADGETTVTYWATDRAGNRSENRTLTVNLDKTPPGTSIASGPSGSTRSTSARFGFSSPEAGATFECKLDGSAFAPCTSPKSYTSLKNGKHTFSVRATDGAGNVDATPAVQTWTVDTIEPTVSGMSPRHKSVIRDTTPTITATIKDKRTNLQERNIKLFVAGKAIPATEFRYSAATDKLIYNSPKLPQGRRNVRIVAADAAKNVGTKSWFFTIR